MATIRDKQVIFDEMLTRDLKYYKVLDSDNKTLLTAQQDKECTSVEAEKSLREFLEKLDGIVYVVLSAKAGDETNQGGNIRNQTFKYQLKLGDSATAINGTSNSSPVGIEAIRTSISNEFDAKMEAMRKEFEHKEEVRKLKDEIKELKEGDGIKEKGLEMLQQILNQNPGVAGVNNPGKANSNVSEAGITGIQGPQNTDRTARLQAAIKKISSVDRDYLDHLEMIAELAVNKPVVYSEALRKLKEY